MPAPRGADTARETLLRRGAALLGSLALAALVAGLFSPSLTGEPIWDDRGYVMGNPAVRDLGALRAAFGTDANNGANPGLPRSSLYRPLTFASLYLNGRLLGPTPAAFHLGNVALQALSAALLFLFLLGRLRGTPAVQAALAAWLAAALWALHPEQTEPVAWISGRYDLLGTCLMLGALLLQDRPGWGAAGLQALLVLGAALSKETFAAVAVVLLVDDLASQGPWRRRLLLGAALLAWLGLRAQAQLEPLLEGQAARSLTALAGDYLSALGIYAGRALAPLPLSLDHPYQPLGPAGLLLTLALAAGAVGWAVRRRALAGPVATWLLLLAPAALMLSPSGNAAERYFLGPSVGLAWALALGLARVLERAPRPGRVGAALAGLAALGLASSATARRLPDWHSDQAVFGAAMRDDPRGWFGPFQLGLVLARDGAPRQGLPLLQQAEAQAEAQQAPATTQGQIRNALALAYLRLDDGPRALASARGAVALAPNYPGLHLTAAWAYAANEELPGELRELDATLQLSPDFHRARGFRALARALSGDAPGARRDLDYLEAHGAEVREDWAKEAGAARAELERGPAG